MKLIKTTLAILAFVCFSFSSNAQRFTILEGDLSAIKGEKTISVEFTYEKMSVGKFENESEYIEKKKAEYNAKETGRGDTWAKTWVTDRKMLFEPKFVDLFEKETEMIVKADSKYTIIFHTTTTEPGYNIYITRKNAEIDGEITIVETANRKHVIAVVAVKNAPGRTFGGSDFATGDRIAECYAVAGKKFGKFLKK